MNTQNLNPADYIPIRRKSAFAFMQMVDLLNTLTRLNKNEAGYFKSRMVAVNQLANGLRQHRIFRDTHQVNEPKLEASTSYDADFNIIKN